VIPLQDLFKCVKCGLPSNTPYCTTCGGIVEYRATRKGCSNCGNEVETRFCSKCGGRPTDIKVVKKPQSYPVRSLEIFYWEAYCGNCNNKPRDPEATKGFCTECGSRDWKNQKRGGCKCLGCNDYSKERYRYCGRCGAIMTDFILEK
jgi:hypothetical protein